MHTSRTEPVVSHMRPATDTPKEADIPSKWLRLGKLRCWSSPHGQVRDLTAKEQREVADLGPRDGAGACWAAIALTRVIINLRTPGCPP